MDVYKTLILSLFLFGEISAKDLNENKYEILTKYIFEHYTITQNKYNSLTESHFYSLKDKEFLNGSLDTYSKMVALIMSLDEEK